MPVLLLLFVVVPLIEIFVIIEVGRAIGVWPTIFLLLLSAVLGTAMVRSQGRAVWRRFNEALAERRIPHRELFDGAMVIFGGALLLTPGFITDVFGLLCLIPPSRAALRRFASRFVIGRAWVGGRTAAAGYGRARDRRTGGPYDVEGTAHEIRDEALLDPPPGEPER